MGIRSLGWLIELLWSITILGTTRTLRYLSHYFQFDYELIVDCWEGNVIQGRSFVSYSFETRCRLRARHLRCLPGYSGQDVKQVAPPSAPLLSPCPRTHL